MRRALRWLSAIGVGAAGFALVWWCAEAWMGVDRSTAVSVAAVVGPMLATPFAWWASREITPSRQRGIMSDRALPAGGFVFISFRHSSDASYARRLASHLTGAGVPVWIDTEIVTGSRWDQVIRDKIDGCAAFLVVMTPQAEESDWVAREIDQAEQSAKPILPLLLSGQRFFRLAHLQYEAVTGGAMPTAAFVARLHALVAVGKDDKQPVPAAANGWPSPDGTGVGAVQSGPRHRRRHSPSAQATSAARTEGHAWLAALSRRRFLVPAGVVVVLVVAADLVLNRPADPAGGDGARAETSASPSPAVTSQAPASTGVSPSPSRSSGPTRLATVPGSGDRLTYNRDGRLLATTFPRSTGSTTVKLWNVGDPARPVASATLAVDYARDVAFAADRSLLATATSSGTVLLWDTGNPASPRRASTISDLPNVANTDPGVGTVAFGFGSDRNLLAITSDGWLTLWDTTNPASPARLAAVEAHGDSVWSVMFSPKGRLLATASDDKTVKLWDTTDPRTPRLNATLPHTDLVRAVAFNPAGTLLASASGNTVRLWEVTTPAAPRRMATLTGHPTGIASVAFSLDGTLLASASLRTLILWSISKPASPVRRATLTTGKAGIADLEFSPRGGVLASTDVDLIMWRM